jgi:putative glutamine amidotransferase
MVWQDFPVVSAGPGRFNDAMKRLPVILISGSTQQHGAELADTSASLSLKYPLAIQTAGGLPWLLPCVPERDFLAESVRRCEGVLLTGGDDVEPRLYAPRLAPTLARTVSPAAPERDLFELMLIDEVFRQRKPLLAICRGHQILNVALGGTLIVDIPTQRPEAMNHARLDRKNEVVHEVTIKAGSILAKQVSTGRLGVNSTHHQAVDKVAKPLRMNAVSDDGMIEGLELAPAERQMLPYLLAVQFHPERLCARHAEHRALFEEFIRACRSARRKHV